MIFFLIILILIIAIMGIAVYESFTGKNGSSTESKTTKLAVIYCTFFISFFL